MSTQGFGMPALYALRELCGEPTRELVALCQYWW